MALFMGLSSKLQGSQHPPCVNNICNHQDDQKHPLNYPVGERGLWCSNQSKRLFTSVLDGPQTFWDARPVTMSSPPPQAARAAFSNSVSTYSFLSPSNVHQLVPGIRQNMESKSNSFPLFTSHHPWDGGFPGGSTVRNLPAMQEP